MHDFEFALVFWPTTSKFKTTKCLQMSIAIIFFSLTNASILLVCWTCQWIESHQERSHFFSVVFSVLQIHKIVLVVCTSNYSNNNCSIISLLFLVCFFGLLVPFFLAWSLPFACKSEESSSLRQRRRRTWTSLIWDLVESWKNQKKVEKRPVYRSRKIYRYF